MSGKIFCIGLNKTATSSLSAALRLLGYRTFHNGSAETNRRVDRAHLEGVPLLTYLGHQWDAYADVQALNERFDVLDRQYPASKFILTTRDIDGWVASRERHVRMNQERAAAGEYDGDLLTVDRDGWVEEREAHEGAVRDYFTGRPDDLLVMDIVAGDGWDVLCPFLGVRVPRRRPFPFLNRSALFGTREVDVVGRRRVYSDRVVSVARRWRRKTLGG